MAGRSHEETGRQNKRHVLAEVLKHDSISRSEIAGKLGLNPASVSRITRELIQAKLVVEKEIAESGGRRGRRFVNLAPHGPGGYVVGVGINAFRQSVTLADLQNNKIASWDFDGEDYTDGEAFLDLCARKAAELVEKHVPDKNRFFGVGLALSGQPDKRSGRILAAPVLGWYSELDAKRIFARHLSAPFVIDTSSAALNMAELIFGDAKGVANVITLHCSIGTGIGVISNGEAVGGALNPGSVLSEAPFPKSTDRREPHDQFMTLEDAMSGRSFVRDVLGDEAAKLKTNSEYGQALVALIDKANAGDEAIRAALWRLGAGYARSFSILFSVLAPELLLLAGPLAESPDFVAAVRRQLELLAPVGERQIAVRATTMTHIGAARWMAIRECVMAHDLDLTKLIHGERA